MPPRQQSRGASRCTSPQHRRETGRSPPRRVTRTGRLQYGDDARAADELRLVQMRFALCDPSRRRAPSDCMTPLKRSSCTFSTGSCFRRTVERTDERERERRPRQRDRKVVNLSTSPDSETADSPPAPHAEPVPEPRTRRTDTTPGRPAGARSPRPAARRGRGPARLCRSRTISSWVRLAALHGLIHRRIIVRVH